MSSTITKILSCPRCKNKMVQTKISKGFVYTCNSCQGLILGTGLLNNIIEQKVAGHLHTSSKPDPAITCAHCNRSMDSGTFNDSDPVITASVCKNCYVTFMDLFEFEHLKNNFAKKENQIKRVIVPFSTTPNTDGLNFPLRRQRFSRRHGVIDGEDIVDAALFAIEIFSDIFDND